MKPDNNLVLMDSSYVLDNINEDGLSYTHDLSDNRNYRGCPECHQWINLHRVYLDKGRWVWCKECGVVLDGSFEGMKEWEWVQWIKIVEEGIGKGELADIVRAARREGRYKALEQWKRGLL